MMVTNDGDHGAHEAVSCGSFSACLSTVPGSQAGAALAGATVRYLWKGRSEYYHSGIDQFSAQSP